MEVKCTRNCKRKDSKGICLASSITIGDAGCGVFIKAPEFEPFRADNVVIYDKAGIPSVMVKFSRVTNRELFGGLDRVHPAFIINGEAYDEIYISKYPNVIINGKAYSLPMQQPAVNVTYEEAQAACRSKGEGWHLWTAMERGLIANICKRDDIFPHGNTDCGKWHEDSSEKGETYGGGYKTLTGSGPATWNHDHTSFGVSDLCGNIWEWFAGLRLINGVLQIVPNNDAAANDTDLSENSERWQNIMADDRPVCIIAEDGITFSNKAEEVDGEDCYDGCEWKDAEFDFEITEEMKELGLYPGEPRAYLYADTDGERLPIAGGGWGDGAGAGVFSLHLGYLRSDSHGSLGFRSAFYRKLNSEI